MAGMTQGERLTRVETQMEAVVAAVERNGHSADRLVTLMEEHSQESREHRAKMLEKINALDLKFTERTASNEKEMATFKARVLGFVAAIGIAATSIGAAISAPVVTAAKAIFQSS